MDASSLIDIFFKNSDNINFYWHFYIGGAVAVFGWYSLRKERPGVKASIAITLVYTALSILNLLTLTNLFSFQQDILNELLKSEDLKKLNTDGIENYFKDMNNDYSIKATYIIHAVTDTAVIFIIWSKEIVTTIRKIDRTFREKSHTAN